MGNTDKRLLDKFVSYGSSLNATFFSSQDAKKYKYVQKITSGSRLVEDKFLAMHTQKDARILTLDVDNVPAGLCLVEVVKEITPKEKLSFVTKTPKGYHFYFSLSHTVQELKFRRTVNTLINLGLPVNFLPTGWSTGNLSKEIRL